MSELDSFLGEQMPETPESVGNFSVDPENMLKRYESLLEDYRDGLLFFFQAAERWGATLVDVKVYRFSIAIAIHLPAGSRGHLKELVESPQVLEELLPKSHPLFEIGHGYKALSNGNPNTSMSFQLSEDWSILKLTHRDDKTLRKLLSVRLDGSYVRCRTHFLFQTTVRLWNRVKVQLDSRPFPQTTEYTKRFLFGLVRPLKTEIPPKPFAHFSHPDRSAVLQPSPVKKSQFPTTNPEGLVFALEHPHPKHELLFFGDGLYQKMGLVPVQNGVALEPIIRERNYGGVIVVFDAEHLQTDFSGLKLLRDDACERELDRCEQIALEGLERIYEIQSEYQPIIGRAEMLKNAAKWTVGAPLSAFFLTGGGLYASSWVLLWKLFYGGFAVAGFHSYAKYIPNPETFTLAVRKERLSWLVEPDLLEELQSRRIEVVPPELPLELPRDYLEVTPHSNPEPESD